MLVAAWRTLTLLLRSVRLSTETLPSHHDHELHAMLGRCSLASRQGKPSGQMDVLSACVRFPRGLDGPKGF